MLRREVAKQFSLEAREARGRLHRQSVRVQEHLGAAARLPAGRWGKLQLPGFPAPVNTEYTHQEADGKQAPQCEINTF